VSFAAAPQPAAFHSFKFAPCQSSSAAAAAASLNFSFPFRFNVSLLFLFTQVTPLPPALALYLSFPAKYPHFPLTNSALRPCSSRKKHTPPPLRPRSAQSAAATAQRQRPRLQCTCRVRKAAVAKRPLPLVQLCNARTKVTFKCRREHCVVHDGTQRQKRGHATVTPRQRRCMVTTADSPICNQLQLKTITARAEAALSHGSSFLLGAQTGLPLLSWIWSARQS
jgi:hypothetical protein